jgi:hypothetical protein
MPMAGIVSVPAVTLQGLQMLVMLHDEQQSTAALHLLIL